MPQVNLSTLSGQELRQLLDASRRRGDAPLSYKILQEMAARREAPAARSGFMKRRPAEPHLIAVELGEPEEVDDVPPMPHWRPPARESEAAAPPEPAAAPAPVHRRPRRKMRPAQTMPPASAAPVAADEDASPSPFLETDRPLSLRDADPEPASDEASDTTDRDLRLPAAGPERPRAPRRHFLRDVAGFAVGITLGIGLGWWGGRIARDVLSLPAAPAAAPIRTAALAPRPAPALAPQAPSAAEPPPAPETPADPAVGPPPNAQEPAANTDSTAIEPPPPPPAPRNADPVRIAETAQSAPDRSTPAVVVKGCAAEATPADREICGDPELRRLQRELQRAYAQALDAHQDRALLRQRQLAWRDARNAVADPDRLARLYEQRIRKLNAATAEARQQR